MGAGQSREATRLPALRQSVAVYRMVFGQPRQDDLVDYLVRHVDAKWLEQVSEELRIDLTPPARSSSGAKQCSRTSKNR